MNGENLDTQRLNYDAIAHVYDEPLRDHPADPHLAQIMAEQGIPEADLKVLDMGCGTGKQQGANRAAYPAASLFGLDLFYGMLNIAKRRSDAVNWVQGSSSAAPLASDLFHVITNQFSYPHVQDKVGMIRETYRLLRPRGRFILRNIEPWSMPDWLIYRYFPEAWGLDSADFLPVDQITSLLSRAGFGSIETTFEDVSTFQTLVEFYEYASDRHRSSEFMAISDEAYAAGLDRLRTEIEAQQGDHPQVKSQVILVTIKAVKF